MFLKGNICFFSQLKSASTVLSISLSLTYITYLLYKSLDYHSTAIVFCNLTRPIQYTMATDHYFNSKLYLKRYCLPSCNIPRFKISYNITRVIISKNRVVLYSANLIYINLLQQNNGFFFFVV